MNGESAFGVAHGLISKADDDRNRKAAAAVGVGAGTGVAGAAVLGGTRMPEHTHYSAKTRKHLHSLPAGPHDVPIKMLMDRPRKLGARKQQRGYVAAMAQERPEHTYSPVPVTRYKGKGNPVIQRDNAHSVMAHAMKGRKTVRINIEDAPGYRPNRRTGEELVRRVQAGYQQQRLKAHHDIGDKKINRLVDRYTEGSRKKNTSKRPHGVVEEKLSYSKKPYGAKRAFGVGRNLTALAKRDSHRDNGVAAGVTGAAGAGVLGTTPVRRSASKVKITDKSISAKDATKIASPGYRPGNKRAIKVMAANMGHLEKEPTKVVRYKDGSVIPFDGNHRMTARVARGDKRVPVQVIEGKNRPAVSVTRNAYHVGQQKLHRRRMENKAFKPDTDPKSKTYVGRHAGEYKPYKDIANASPARSGKRVDIGSSRFGSGPGKGLLRAKQGATVAAGAGLLGTAAFLHRKKD